MNNRNKFKESPRKQKIECFFKNMLLNHDKNIQTSRTSSIEAERNSQIDIDEMLKEEKKLVQNNKKMKFYLKYAPISKKIIYSPITLVKKQ